MSIPLSSSSTTDNLKKSAWIEKYLPEGLPDDPNHPAQIALRTYAVSLSLSLGPSLLPFVLGLLSGRNKTKARSRSLTDVLKRELGPNGFAFAITAAVGGGAALQRAWQLLEDSSDYGFGVDTNPRHSGSLAGDATPVANILARNETYRKLRRWIASHAISSERKTFISNLISSTIAITLLHSRRRSKPIRKIDIPLTAPIELGATKHGPSPTLDLTLLLLVRAVDATIQSLVFKRSMAYWPRSRNLSAIDILGDNGEILVSQAGAMEAQRKKEQEMVWRQKMTTRIDAFIFWACSARSVFTMRGLIPSVYLRGYFPTLRIMWCFFYEPQR